MTNSAHRIVVTGLGIVSAAGSSVAALLETLKKRVHCLSPISMFDADGMTMTHAGEIADFDPCTSFPPVRIRSLDRATQMAWHAARQAYQQANQVAGIDPETTGLIIGVSGAHQYQNMPVTAQRTYPVNRRTALYFSRSSPAFQADSVATSLGLCGPRLAFGSASLGGLVAVAHACDLLRSGHASAILVGGAEIQTMVNALGMDTLGLGAKGPCVPFSSSSGMSFGEGAAFLMLETLEHAQGRGTPAIAEIAGSGVSSDAYHEISNDPSGRGLSQAIKRAIANSGCRHEDIAWIRTSGTGHRVQDLAERLAFEQCFDRIPPVTSTEPYFGHANGVSPLLGLLTGIAAQQAGVAPVMPAPSDLQSPLPLLQDGPMPDGDWLLNAVAFGGGNGALVVGSVKSRAASAKPDSEIYIAGAGMVSAFGLGYAPFLRALRAQTVLANQVRKVDPDLKIEIPGVNLKRREQIVRWCMSAVAQALNDAGLQAKGQTRIGLLLGLSRGPMSAYERFCAQVLQGDFNASTGRSLLKTGRFSVASELAHAFSLSSYGSTVCPGVHGGVQLLAHGTELLRNSHDLDALLVVAADEWTQLCEGFYQKLGLCGSGMHAYDNNGSGLQGAEGAAAIVLTRHAVQGTSDHLALAKITGVAFGSDPQMKPQQSGLNYASVMKRALQRGQIDVQQLDFVIGQGCGWPAYDERELAALAQLRTDLPLSSVQGHAGLLESCGGLLSAIVASTSLRDGCVPPLFVKNTPEGLADFIVKVPRHGNFKHALVCGSTERGVHSSIVLQTPSGTK